MLDQELVLEAESTPLCGMQRAVRHGRVLSTIQFMSIRIKSSKTLHKVKLRVSGELCQRVAVPPQLAKRDMRGDCTKNERK